MTYSKIARAYIAILSIISIILIPTFAGAQSGIWTKLKNRIPNSNTLHFQLLSNGSVLLQKNNWSDSSWYILVPDINGSYVNGNISQIANSHYIHVYCPQQILKDGRFYIGGGEYGSNNGKCEIYNPLNNTWTITSDANFVDNLGSPIKIIDANAIMMSDGKVLQSSSGFEPHSKLYDPAANTWSNDFKAKNCDYEGAWLRLPDKSILSLDMCNSTNANFTERFFPSTNQWISDSSTKNRITDNAGEMGASYLLPNGKVIAIGAHQNNGVSPAHTAIYTPSGNAGKGSWSTGPDFSSVNVQDTNGITYSRGLGQQDGAGAMMINGKLILKLSATVDGNYYEFNGPSYFYEYDYNTNTLSKISAPSINGLDYVGSPSFQGYFLPLPSGEILYADASMSDMWVYTPNGLPLVNGKPTISSLTPQATPSTYTLTGTKLGGLNDGGSYGDDAQYFTNFPIVRLKAPNNSVYYARTFNWSTRDVMTGNRIDSVNFTLPANLPAGTYSLVVTVNGIASDPVTFCSYSTNNEPNESFATATTLGSNATVNGGITSTGDVDWYKITLSAPGDLRVIMQPGINQDVDMALYQSNGTTQISSSILGPGSADTVKGINLAAGNYYVKLYDGGTLTQDCYTLSASVCPTITSQPVSQTTCAGGSATFTVAASNAASYAWEVQYLPSTWVSTGTNSNTNSYTNLSLSNNGYRYRVKVTNGGCTVISNEATLTVNNCVDCASATTNIALNKTASASSIETGTSFTADKAVDGNATTRWSSNAVDNSWYQVDLGANYNICKVSLKWENAYGKNYNIQVSGNGSTWTTVQTVTNNTTYGTTPLTYTFTNVTGRYVRMQGVTRGTGYGYSLYEFEVYGTPGPVTRGTGTTGITGINSTIGFKVYPNPVRSELIVEYNADETTSTSISLTDIDGHEMMSRTVNSMKGNNREGFDVSRLPAGTYLVHIQLVNGKQMVQKITIQH